MAVSKLAALLALGAYSLNTEAAQPSAVGLLLGHWDALSTMFSAENIIVGQHALTIGTCRHIRYAVIRDTTSRDVREIAIELLLPSDPKCRNYWRVMDFSIDPTTLQ